MQNLAGKMGFSHLSTLSGQGEGINQILTEPSQHGTFKLQTICLSGEEQ
jgi:hypothetical protein